MPREPKGLVPSVTCFFCMQVHGMCLSPGHSGVYLFWPCTAGRGTFLSDFITSPLSALLFAEVGQHVGQLKPAVPALAAVFISVGAVPSFGDYSTSATRSLIVQSSRLDSQYVSFPSCGACFPPWPPSRHLCRPVDCLLMFTGICFSRESCCWLTWTTARREQSCPPPADLPL